MSCTELPSPVSSTAVSSQSKPPSSSNSPTVPAASVAAVSPPSLPAVTSMDTTTSQKEAHAGSFDLQTCSAKDLATALISSRGKEDAVQILQQATKLAEQQQDDDASSEEHQDATAVVELGDALLSQPVEMSFVAPRLGKFQVRLHQHGLVAVKATDATQQQQQVVIESSNISHVLVFPKPEDCKIMTQPHLSAEAKQKKLNGCLVFLQLAEEMVIQKKSVAQLCFALPSDKKTGPVGPSVETEPEEDDPTTQWCHLLKQSLVSSDNNNNNKTAFARIQPGFGFKSFQPDNTSTTSGGMPFVKCYMGVNDGVLYPLEEGLLFFKPPKFVPRSDLRSIACGRGNGGGQSSSRYVDMVVQLHNDTNSLEFSNIQREENGVLNQYIHKVLVPAMQVDAENEEEEEDDDDVVAEAKVDDDEGEESLAQAEEGGADEESEDDDDDEDFDEEESAEGSSDVSDDGDDHDEDDDVEVVQDDFAKELAKEKRKKQQEDSATESENDDDDDQRRTSKRLRRNGDE